MSHLSCDVCSKTFHRKSALNEHVKYTHTTERKFICSECGKSYKRKDHLKRHNEVSHDSNSKMYICNICGLEISLKYNYKRHMLGHNKEKPFVCNEKDCDQSFGKENELMRHKRDDHSILPYCCDFPNCNKEYPLACELKMHKKSHTVKYMCGFDNCGQQFIKYRDLLDHTKQHPLKIVCPYCTKEFPRQDNLKKHINNMHSKEQPVYSCPICGLESKYERNITYNHIKCKHAPASKTIQCDHCEKVFSYNSSKKRHMEKYHLHTEETLQKPKSKKRKPMNDQRDVLLGGIPPRNTVHLQTPPLDKELDMDEDYFET